MCWREIGCAGILPIASLSHSESTRAKCGLSGSARHTGGVEVTLDDDLPAILTVDQAAAVLRISRGLAFAAVRSGEIPSLRIGRRILVPRDALQRVLLGTAQAPRSAAMEEADRS